jgi:hypothetical protein
MEVKAREVQDVMRCPFPAKHQDTLEINDNYNKTINDFQFDGYQDLLTQE